MKLLNQINTMERLDQLIRLRATGSLDELAYKLDISVSTVKRNIEAMKTLGAPIVFNFYNQNYEYEYGVNFVFGFQTLQKENLLEIQGGFSILKKSLTFL